MSFSVQGMAWLSPIRTLLAVLMGGTSAVSVVQLATATIRHNKKRSSGSNGSTGSRHRSRRRVKQPQQQHLVLPSVRHSLLQGV